MNIREVSISRLREYENNPRNNDLAVEKVKYSIDRFGFLFPVVIDINYVIVCGHTRVRACRELGIQTVPCIIADELTEEQINLFRLVDNKTSEYSDWDFDKLKEELSLVDLTLDENQLLLDRFELSAEVFDIEPEQAEIKIPSFNFMGDDEPRHHERKPTVKTISGETDDEIDEDDEDVDFDSGYDEGYGLPKAFTDDGDSDEPEGMPHFNSDGPVPDFGEAEDDEEEPESAAPERRPLLPLYQFRFGDVAFFISKVELDRLNEKYTEYIDSGAALERSFADYLLEGVESRD